MLWLGTQARAFPVTAALESPVAPDLWAARVGDQRCAYLLPPYTAVLLHVAEGNSVRDSLVTKRVD